MRSVAVTISEHGVATVTLNQPERLNALSVELCDDLRAELARLAVADNVKAIVITGAGRAFSAGGDITALTPKPQADGHVDLGQQISELMIRCFRPLMSALMAFPKPVVSAINGLAVGGGAGIALCADVVLAGREGKIKFVQGQQMGIIADLGASWLLQRVAGRQTALAAVLLGETINAERLERLGLVWEVVEDSQLLSRAQIVAQSLCRVPCAVVLASRNLIDAATTATYDQLLELERVYLRDLGTRPELLAMVNGFLKK